MRKSLWVRILGAALGLALLAWFVRNTDRVALERALAGRVSLIPLCVLVELIRVGAETQATRSVLGKARKLVSFRRMYAVHLVGFAFSAVLPAPRPIAEATKASLIAKRVGLARCVNVGTVNQAATLLAISVACVGCALLTSRCPSLQRLLFANAVFLAVSGGGLLALVRSPRLHAWLAKRWPKRAESFASFGREAARAPVLAPTAWLFASVCLQGILFGLLLRGTSSAPFIVGSATAEGAHMVSASIGVLVPGQLGIRELAFAEVADGLGTNIATAGALSLLPRAAQLFVAGIGFATLAFLRDRRIEGSDERSDEVKSPP